MCLLLWPHVELASCSLCCSELCGHYASMPSLLPPMTMPEKLLHDQGKRYPKILLQVEDRWAQHIMSLLEIWWALYGLYHLSKKLCIYDVSQLQTARRNSKYRSSPSVYYSTVQHLIWGSLYIYVCTTSAWSYEVLSLSSKFYEVSACCSFLLWLLTPAISLNLHLHGQLLSKYQWQVCCTATNVPNTASLLLWHIHSESIQAEQHGCNTYKHAWTYGTWYYTKIDSIVFFVFINHFKTIYTSMGTSTVDDCSALHWR